jgi:chromosome segregation protein
MARMGPVNLLAIEEARGFQSRYDFLTVQKADLEEARHSLYELIDKIERQATRRFLDTFEKIQRNFDRVFKELFGGGRAELVLLDKANPLDFGIDIKARPPGRKLQSISLLSGGEKALTAIALLFGIFMVKPSPFCILDEIDAALDEASIERFTKMLANFAKQSQFIIITHNKETIKASDIMYGVTMEESGVSKIVSVRFAREAVRGGERG